MSEKLPKRFYHKATLREEQGGYVVVLEQFLKSVKRFSDKNCSKTKELERFVEPSETKTALEQFPTVKKGEADKNCGKTPQQELLAEPLVSPSNTQAALNARAVKTPARRLLLLPNKTLAKMVCDEFNAVQEVVNPANMPLTRIANTVIDGIADNPAGVVEDILRFIASDMVCYRADYPPELVERQREAWDPVLDFVADKWGYHFHVGEGVRPIEQPREGLRAIAHYLNKISSPFMLASLHVMTTITGSGLLALAVMEGALSVKKVWEIAHLDEDWTNEHWGEDAQAMERRLFRQDEFYAAAAMMAALQDPR